MSANYVRLMLQESESAEKYCASTGGAHCFLGFSIFSEMMSFLIFVICLLTSIELHMWKWIPACVSRHYLGCFYSY